MSILTPRIDAIEDSIPGRTTGNLTVGAWTSGSVTNVLSREIVYQTTDGTWRCRFNIKISITGSSAVNSGTFTITGFTAKNDGNGEQGIHMAHQTQQMAFSAYISPNSGDCTWFSAGNLANGAMHVWGDIDLESKPSWA